MALDNLTLLFSLSLVSGLMSLSLAVTSSRGARNGLSLWSIALAMESASWAVVAARGWMPLFHSVLFGNLFMVGAQSIKLAAICQYRGVKWPMVQSALPVLLMFLLLLLLPEEDFAHRIIYTSLIYLAQTILIAQALKAERPSRGDRAWWLIYGATLAMAPILVIRIIAAMFISNTFATPGAPVAPNAVQLLVFIGVIALDQLGALGFILLVKERAEREVRKLAMTDGLTGILNRRAFMERARQEMATARRTQWPLALLMLDIDHFKQVNDHYGHAAGDMVLVEFSQLVRQRLRTQDTFGRYGGEEFCILMPATDETGAFTLAEDLRRTVESRQFLLGEAALSVTVTIGVGVCYAKCAQCPLDFNKILVDADRALYQGKAGGRNRTVTLPLGCDSGER